MRTVQIQDGQFTDSAGRSVILHGINMVCKDQGRNYIGPWTRDDFAKLKEWGLNVIRLGIFWDGVEPHPGEYDDAYLDRNAELIKLAAEYGIWVVLDMHQDLFGYPYGGGAPSWAVLTDGKPHVPTKIWSDAYLLSPAIWQAFDSFWQNRPAVDGLGLQDHYARAWRYVASRYRDYDHVIGYDIMNEPFIGSAVNQIQPLMYEQFHKEWGRAREDMDFDELFAAWLDPKRRPERLEILNDVGRYARVIGAVTRGYGQFECGILSSFYQRVAEAIRSVDQDGIIFLETNYFGNIGFLSNIQPVRDQRGTKDPSQAYAPHGYDLVTDTESPEGASPQRLRFIFQQHELTRNRLQAPMFVGEWGAFYNSQQTKDIALCIKDIFEQLLCGDAYWSYEGPHMAQLPFFPSIRRGYPMAVSGKIQHYYYDADTGYFECTWQEDGGNESTTIYLPDCTNPRAWQIQLAPEGSSFSLEPLGETAGYLHIPPWSPCCGTVRVLRVEGTD
ncbi:MAG: cellulase family glycosylhydrolase [Methanothrix sp.]|nr:cellulase family glycosylhydrolase [Methanothrix sp.]